MEADVKSASITSGESDKFSLVKQPILPKEPASPSRLAIALLGLIASIVVGFMCVTIAEAIDPSVRGARDVRLALNELPLNAIPKIRTLASKRRQSRQVTLAAILLLVGVPVLFVLVRSVVR
jgi:capsular polysaccharide biosynthesis protein